MALRLSLGAQTDALLPVQGDMHTFGVEVWPPPEPSTSQTVAHLSSDGKTESSRGGTEVQCAEDVSLLLWLGRT